MDALNGGIGVQSPVRLKRTANDLDGRIANVMDVLYRYANRAALIIFRDFLKRHCRRNFLCYREIDGNLANEKEIFYSFQFNYTRCNDASF